MKTKVITCVSSLENIGIKRLEASLIHNKLDYKIIHDPNTGWNYEGWANMYNWCKSEEAKEYTHFLWTDGFDTFALARMEEIESKFKKICGDDLDRFVYSCEKQFYPNEKPDLDWQQLYMDKVPELTENHRWRYCNGGQFMTSIPQLIRMYEWFDKNQNNQWLAHNRFIFHNEDNKVLIDYNCEIFQSVSFGGEGHIEFDIVEPVDPIGKRLHNKLLDTYPCFAHGNGMGVVIEIEMKYIYDIINTY